MIAYTLTNNSITVVLNNKVYTVSNGQPQWEPVLEAIRNNDEKTLHDVLSVANTIVAFTEGNVTIKDNQVFYRNVPLDNYVVEKVLDFAKNKLPLQPILRFINNLMKNPSRSAVQELYKFLEHKNMPITPDGNFLAYKGVQSDYYSKTAGSIIVIKGKVVNGKIYNGIGEEIEVERNGVCDDRNQGCSSGLHAGSVTYATDFGRGGHVVIVEINPIDVVSVPDDCSCQKLRACRYKVVGEYEVPLDHNYNNSYSNEDWNDNDDDDGDDDGDTFEEACCGDDGDEDYDESTEQCQCPDCLQNQSEPTKASTLDDVNKLFEPLFAPKPKSNPELNYESQFDSLFNPNPNLPSNAAPNLEAEIKRLIESANADIKQKLDETAEYLRAFSAQINVPKTQPVPTAEQLKKTAKTALEQLRDALDNYKNTSK